MMDRLHVYLANISMASIANDELSQIEALRENCGDLPMDFADATLVHLAARESLSLILTVDHDDFETCRIAGPKKFNILPHRTPRVSGQMVVPQACSGLIAMSVPFPVLRKSCLADDTGQSSLKL